jgi:uncharacterized membrane protein YraQ (UPF0718 family)
MSWLADWFGALWAVLAQSGPYLLVGFFLAGLLEVLIPRGWIRRHLGGRGLGPVTRAALVGAPVPLCSCSVLPTAAQLRREGASPGATTSFLIATPETGIDSIGITYALMDPLMTVVRPVTAIATAIGAGLAVDAAISDPPAPEPEHDCCDDHDHDHDHAAPPAKNRLVRAIRYAFGPLMADLTPWFVLGFALAAVITLAVPVDFFGGTISGGLPAMGLMLLAGIPLYVCATASTPIAAALMAKGLEPGPALVFLLAGPATNVATMGVVRGLLGGRALWIYVGSIAACSLLAGFLVQGLYVWFDLQPVAFTGADEHGHQGPIAEVGGALLAGLLAVHLVAWLRRAGKP